jgi:large subunit ribosomal protein L35
MPKSKTKSGAKKRFQVTGSGKIKRKKAFKRHILTKKETKRKRSLGNDAMVHPSDVRSIKAQLLA